MKLVPLRIPGGWFVVHNNFYDISPEVVNGKLSGPFVQDILSIERRRPSSRAEQPPDFILDLGWYPDQDPDGQYHLVLLYEKWENQVKSVESRDRVVIQATLDRWLELCTDTANLDKLLKRL